MKRILTVWKKELKDTIRDKRTLIVAIVLPIVFMPLIMVGSFKLQESQIKSAAEKTAVIAFSNSENVPSLVEFFQSQAKIEIKENIVDGHRAILDGEINVYIDAPSDFETSINEDNQITIDLYEKSTDYNSDTAYGKVAMLFTVYNNLISTQKITAAGLSPNLLKNVEVQKQDLATSEERGGFILGLLLPMFLVIFAMMGGMYLAIDVSAGEKERKTLEAILLVPLSRLQIVSGKFLAVATTSIITVVLAIFSMYTSFKIWPPDFGGEFGSGLEFSLTGSTVLIMIGIGILLSIMFAALLLAVAIFAKSYKEAQNYITPFYLLTILPVSLLSSMPGFKPGLAFFCLPAINAVLLFKEVLMGAYITSHIIITFSSLFIFSLIAIFIATKIFSKESILFRD